MPEAITSQLSAGGGRIIDAYWPHRMFWRNNGSLPGAVWLHRNGFTGGNVTTTFTINPNEGFNANINGRSGVTIGSVVAASGNGVNRRFSDWIIQHGKRGIGVANPPPNLAGLDQFGAHRLLMIASFNNPVAPLGTAVDNGLELTTASTPSSDDGCMLFKGTPGLGFRVYDTDKCEVTWRGVQAGAVSRVDVATAADGYRAGDWHAYEIRIIAAQGSQEALAKFLIDGVLKLTLSWGPGNIMPETNTWSGITVGLCPYLITTAGTAGGFTVDSLHYQVARDELNLL